MINNNGYSEYEGYERMESGFVINDNESEYQRFLMNRQRVLRQKGVEERVNQLEKEILQLKKVISKINSRLP